MNKEEIEKAKEFEFITENINSINKLHITKKGELYINCLLTSPEVLLNYIQQLETKVKELEEREQKVKDIIKQLDKDEENIRFTKQKKSEGLNYIDDYTKCRLKAYITKTKEIKNRLLKIYKEGENNDK